MAWVDTSFVTAKYAKKREVDMAWDEHSIFNHESYESYESSESCLG